MKRKLILFPLLLLISFVLPFRADAQEITAPAVPESGRELMPEGADSFGEGLAEILRDAVSMLRPDLAEAASTCCGIFAAVLLVSLLKSFPGVPEKISELTGTVCVSAALLTGVNSLIHLGSQTVAELSAYGKLLLPVMTTALAAQGGVTSSAALYTGTALFNTLLGSLITGILIPLIYIYLAFAGVNSAVGEEMLKKLRDLVKWLMTWCLKIILYVFTGYMGITGVVSGTTDAAALKATKLTISGMVPVVGGILSDASEAVLVSAGLAKNAAGIYGIFAILAVSLGPFLRIGVHYLLLKSTAALSSVFGAKRITDLIGDFSSAMGLLLAMTGTQSLLLLISTVCFLREVGI